VVGNIIESLRSTFQQQQMHGWEVFEKHSFHCYSLCGIIISSSDGFIFSQLQTNKQIIFFSRKIQPQLIFAENFRKSVMKKYDFLEVLYEIGAKKRGSEIFSKIRIFQF
jgi:hypothetical protein